MALPMAGRWAGSTVRSCFIRAGTCPFLLRYFCQKAASVSLEATCARSASACRASSSMIACIHFLSFVQNGNLRFGTEQKRAPPPGRHCQPRDGALLLNSVVPPKFRAGARSARHSNAVTGHAVPHYRAAGRGRRSRGPLGSELPRRRRSGALAAGGAPLCARRTARTFSVIAFCLFRSAYSSTLCPLLQAPQGRAAGRNGSPLNRFYGVSRLGPRNRNIHSLMLRPTSSMVSRSMPRPKPPWGGQPYWKNSR